jgi:hypothetical protein
LEADFQREYGIDLSRSLARISWRRFCALVAGFSPESRWQLALKDDKEQPRVIEDPKEAERFVLSAF